MKGSLIILFGLIAFVSFGQTLDPVTWSSEVKSMKDGTQLLVITADIDKGWHLYSQHTDPSGPVPTTFENKTDGIEWIGEVKEVTKPDKGMSDMFGVEVIQFDKSATFEQVFKSNGQTLLNTDVRFMTCDGLKCLPPKTITLTTKF